MAHFPNQKVRNRFWRKLEDMHRNNVFSVSVASLSAAEQRVVREYVEEGWLFLTDVSPHEVPVWKATTTDNFRRGVKV